MLNRARHHFIAWLLERHPQVWFRWKKIGKHRLCTDRDFLALQAQSLREGEGLQVLEERYNLWILTQSVARLPGALAEVGVYRGGSAKFIAAAKGGADLHLFDTFAGMPPVNSATDGAFREGESGDTSVEHVRAYLATYPAVYLHPGFFPPRVRSSSASPDCASSSSISTWTCWPRRATPWRGSTREWYAGD